MKGFLAALMMLTRLPLWKIVKVEKEYYTRLLVYWPFVGFLTGLTTWGVFWLANQALPILASSILAVIARLLLTGALHEDGLGDFFDGFGGGRDREQILSIMKDSHIGSYGTIGLILYFLLYVSLLQCLYPPHAAGIIIGADVSAKYCAAVLINTLHYARTEASSKTHLVYEHIRTRLFIIATLIIAPLLWLLKTPWAAFIPAIGVAVALRYYFYKKIQGYTGDCCGASFLLIEIAFYIGAIFYI